MTILINRAMRARIVGKLRARNLYPHANAGLGTLCKAVASCLRISRPLTYADQCNMLRAFARDDGVASAGQDRFRPLQLTREMRIALERTAQARKQFE